MMVPQLFRSITRVPSVVLAALLAGGVATPATAQVPAGCTQLPSSNGQKSVLRCGDIAIELEGSPDRQLGSAGSRRADGNTVDLRRGAALFEVRRGRQFRIRTPHAIAAVRGTTYVVDVGRGETDVFVLEGRVIVSRRTDGARVTLGPGDGIDVSRTKPMVVRRWGDGRVAALLARIGR